MIIVQRLNENTEYEPIGRVADGRIIDGEEKLCEIAEKDVWINSPPERLLALFSGPRIIAGQVFPEDQTKSSDDPMQSRQAEDYEYPSVPPEDAPPEVKDAIERFRNEVPEEIKQDTPLLYWLLGEGTPDYKFQKEDADYQNKPKDGMRCGNCEYYYEGMDGSGVCSWVRGNIQRSHWCRFWKEATIDLQDLPASFPDDAPGSDSSFDPENTIIVGREESERKALIDKSKQSHAVYISKSGGENWVPYEGPRGGEGWQNIENGEIRYQRDKPDSIEDTFDSPGYVSGSPEPTEPSEVSSGEHIVVEDRRSGVRSYFTVEENNGEGWTGGVSYDTDSGIINVVSPESENEYASYELIGSTNSRSVARQQAIDDDYEVNLGYRLSTVDGETVLSDHDFVVGDYVHVIKRDPQTDEIVREEFGLVSDVYDGIDELSGEPTSLSPKIEVWSNIDVSFDRRSFDLRDEIEIKRPAGAVVNTGDDEELSAAEKEAISNVEYYNDSVMGFLQSEENTLSQDQIEVVDNAVQSTIGALKSDKVARDVTGEGFRPIQASGGTGRDTAGSIHRKNDYPDRRIRIEISDRSDESVVKHEMGHLLAEIYGYSIDSDASREVMFEYEPMEEYDWQYDDDAYLLKTREDETIGIGSSYGTVDSNGSQRESVERYPSFADPPEKVERLIEAANDAWLKQKEYARDPDIDWKSATVSLGYSQVNAHETLANFHEKFQTEDAFEATKAATTVIRHHQELWNAYIDVFDPSDEMKRAVENWKTVIQGDLQEPRFERMVAKSDDDPVIGIYEDGSLVGSIGFDASRPNVSYSGSEPFLGRLSESLPHSVVIPYFTSPENPDVSSDRTRHLRPDELLEQLKTIFSGTLYSSLQKDWIEYSGPQGGEGWRNTESGEVRYQENKPEPQSVSYDTPNETNPDSGSGNEEFETSEVSFRRVSSASPSQLAGGIAAAVDDDRDDFHEVRNAITRADSQEQAMEVINESLSDDTIENVIEEVELQQDLRQEWLPIESPADVAEGQEVLIDKDRPLRGVIDDVDVMDKFGLILYIVILTDWGSPIMPMSMLIRMKSGVKIIKQRSLMPVGMDLPVMRMYSKSHLKSQMKDKLLVKPVSTEEIRQEIRWMY